MSQIRRVSSLAAKISMAFLFTTVLLVSCRLGSDEGVLAPPGTGLAISKRTSISTPVAGDCVVLIGSFQSTPTDGSLPRTNTACSIPDSALVRIGIYGKFTASVNPNYSCCFSLSPNKAGTYGPMGGGNSDNWQNLFVRVPVSFGNGSSTTLTGLGAYSAGDTAHNVVVFEGAFLFKQGSTLSVERYPLGGSGSCVSHPAPTPAGCLTPSGYAYAYGAQAYLLSGTQYMKVERLSRTLKLVAVPDTIYAGDTAIFRASSSDGRAISIREWLWQDSTGALSGVACSTSSTECRYAPTLRNL